MIIHARDCPASIGPMACCCGAARATGEHLVREPSGPPHMPLSRVVSLDAERAARGGENVVVLRR